LVRGSLVFEGWLWMILQAVNAWGQLVLLFLDRIMLLPVEAFSKQR
jgi:hypothetical protein